MLGHDQEATAVLSTAVVSAFEQEGREQISFVGPAVFHEKTARHLKEVVAPIVDQLLKALNLPPKRFEISVANIEASSINEIGLNISGNSLDVPVLAAMLSAAFEIPIDNEIAFTGHIASLHGDIRMVAALPAKLKAVEDSDLITSFVHPVLDQDGSLDSLSPTEKQRIAGAIAMAKRTIHLIPVKDLTDLIRAIFSDEQIALVSLKKGFYETYDNGTYTDSPIGKAAELLRLNNTVRFWKALEQRLMRGRNKEAKNLLCAMVDFHLQQERYPKKLGNRLLQLIQSLPPETRRLKVDFPLFSMAKCIKITQFAEEVDHEDVKFLFRATSGEISGQSEKVPEKKTSRDPVDEDARDKLSLILSEMDVDALAPMSQDIDLARATYLLDSVTVESNNGLVDTITSFYIHMIRHTRKLSEQIDLVTAGAEALALLERAFSGSGGFNTALSESKTAVNGGLRVILDKMTEQFKMEQQEKHINHVLKSVMDPLDWESKVSLMRALLKRLQNYLPSDIVSEPPDRFAGKWEAVVKGYVKSADQMKFFFRSL